MSTVRKRDKPEVGGLMLSGNIIFINLELVTGPENKRGLNDHAHIILVSTG